MSSTELKDYGYWDVRLDTDAKQFQDHSSGNDDAQVGWQTIKSFASAIATGRENIFRM